MIGHRQIATTWVVGDAWEKYSTQRVEVVWRAFRVVGLSLPIDRGEDHELSIKTLANDFLAEGLKEWEVGGVGQNEGIMAIKGIGWKDIAVVDRGEVEDSEEEINFQY